MNDHAHRPWWETKAGLVLLGFLAIASFFLFTEHMAHLFGVLPYLLLLACPLMHLFMHGGRHGHHGHDSRPPGERLAAVRRRGAP